MSDRIDTPGEVGDVARRLVERVPGAVVGRWDDTDGLQIGAAGVCALDQAVTADTVFDLASVTKLFTTAAVMRLVHEGAVDLDAPVSRGVELPEPVLTVRHLLSHRGGLLPWQPLYLRGDRSVADAIRDLPRRDHPGNTHCYSDLGFMVLGAVVAAVTGAPLAQAMDDLICTPLGLRASYGPRTGEVATSAYGDGAERRMVATGEPYEILLPLDSGNAEPFEAWRDHPLTGEVNDGNAHHALNGVSGHAGLFADASDLILLGRAFGRTDHGLWDTVVLDEFTTPVLSRSLSKRGASASKCKGVDADSEQGLGFRLRTLPDGRVLAWHPGFTGTALGFTLGESTTVVTMLTNRLLTTSEPVPTAQLWEDVLSGTGLIEESHDEDH